MLYKIMRAVKSSNKKRGRNITIGAVVGLLLSCTAVMRADVVGLEIGKDNDTIIFKDKTGDSFTPGEENDPYPDNEWDVNTYTNNSIIIGEATISGAIGIGLRLNDDLGGNFKFENNGIIRGTNKATGNTHYHSYGISMSTLTGNLMNEGVIIGYAKDIDSSYGYGIEINSLFERNSNLINTGVIYGKTNAIKIDSGAVNNAVNYGILVTDGDSAVLGLDIKNKTKDSIGDSGENKLINYGLIINKGGASQDDITTGTIGNNPIDVIVGYDTDGKTSLRRKMTIKNSDSYEEKIDSFILNALNNTYITCFSNNTVIGSIINAYKNAIFFAEDGTTLTLSGTIVNGGIKDGTVAILGNNIGNEALILEGANVSYTDGEKRFQQTIINGDINMQDGNNTVTLKNGSVVNGSITTGTGSDTLNIENGSQINGILEGGTGDDTLTFEKRLVTKSTSNSDEIRILHNISNFENINVNSNVTFYETDVAVTGAKEIKIGADGALTLRINGSDKDSSSGKIKGHALYGNTGTIISEGGELLLTLNKLGNKNIVSFGDTKLGNGLTNDTIGTTSKLHTIERISDNEIMISSIWDLPDYLKYPQLNKIYHGILSVDDLIGNFNVDDDDEKLSIFLGYLNDIYAGSPYSYSSELSRKSVGMFRDIVTDNQFKVNTGKWMIYGGLTHIDGGTKDTYYGKGYYTYDIGSSDMDVDTKITGAYMLGEYGISDTLTSGVVIGGNKLKSDLSNGSKVDGSAMYLGAYAKKYIGNLKVTVGAGFQYGDYDADRLAVNKVASDSAESVMKYSDNYNDITYDIYLNGRYSNPIGDNLFLEPYATLSYTYIDQDGASEGNKTLAIETDSKSFDYTVGKVGVDLKKVIPHEKGKSTLTAGVSYAKILDGAEEEYITGRFKNGSDFDILVAHKNEHSIGLNAKYAIELENGILFDVKGTYSAERDSHNGSGKNKTKGEWIVGAGMGYKF
ncbi:hypothetical protein F350042L8_04090 [Fusobacterium ulcerans]|uniref:autotransporter family protein n=1 Tax=Fusobacterium ulcerans TaxID=861 RepID=UPI0034A761FA